MFDLNARIDLDEIELVGLGIHQELDSPRAAIICFIAQFQRRVGQRLAGLFRKIWRRRALNDLLVAPLHRTVALEQMHQIAMIVAEQLHLDVPGLFDELFEIHLVLAERRLGLALALRHFGPQLLGIGDAPHAASAPAPACLEHQGITDRIGHFGHFIEIVGQWVRGRNHRHARLDRHVARRDLVAQIAHGLRFRPDKDDPGIFARIGKLGTFRQEPVTGMDRIGARNPRHADIFVDLQIGFHRPLALPDQIGLVRLEPVQRQLVLLGKHRNRFQPQLVGGPEHPDRNLRAVGDENLLDRHGLGNPLLERARIGGHHIG